MAVTRADKEAELQQLEQAFKGSDSAIVVAYKGLNVPQVTERPAMTGGMARTQVKSGATRSEELTRAGRREARRGAAEGGQCPQAMSRAKASGDRSSGWGHTTK